MLLPPMRVCLLSLFLLISVLSLKSQSISLAETRTLYQKSATDKPSCELLYQRLTKTTCDDNPVLSGYFGAVNANMANHIKEPAQKLKYFNTGRRIIEKAVQTDSLNAEIRFIRFTIQSNCPKSLKYNSSIPEDKAYLISYLHKNKNTEFKKRMTSYLISSDWLSQEEKNRLLE